jgi:hypothetical protein
VQYGGYCLAVAVDPGPPHLPKVKPPVAFVIPALPVWRGKRQSANGQHEAAEKKARAAIGQLEERARQHCGRSRSVKRVGPDSDRGKAARSPTSFAETQRRVREAKAVATFLKPVHEQPLLDAIARAVELSKRGNDKR